MHGVLEGEGALAKDGGCEEAEDGGRHVGGVSSCFAKPMKPGGRAAERDIAFRLSLIHI